ncbi:MAG: 4-(cytidine 5'-diphospho)-2-C-methyl-D-erythritol kinase [Pseudomonadota bacterium]
MTERAPAKLNLSLHVVGRRSDGYHLLDSLVVFTELADTVALRPGGTFGFSVDGPFAPATPMSGDNLVLRAAESLGEWCGRPLSGAFRLTKRLPAAAGVGGGSADAAATLRLLCRHWSLDLDDPGVLEIAVSLGADVPVCLRSRRCHMSGIGEVVTQVAPEASRPVVLVNPGIALSTAEVFKQYARMASGTDRPSANDLLAPAIALAPQIGDILRELSATKGCRATAMSGSGPTCFAFYDDPAAASAAESTLSEGHPAWWVAATRLLD